MFFAQKPCFLRKSGIQKWNFCGTFLWMCRWNFWGTQFRCILVFSILFRHEKFSSSCIMPKPPLYEEAIALYKISFPHHEQREQASQCEILKNTDYHFEVICDEGCLIGKILYWCIEKLRYIEHFCILPSMRNQHYGQKILAALQEEFYGIEADGRIPNGTVGG